MQLMLALKRRAEHFSHPGIFNWCIAQNDLLWRIDWKEYLVQGSRRHVRQVVVEQDCSERMDARCSSCCVDLDLRREI